MRIWTVFVSYNGQLKLRNSSHRKRTVFKFKSPKKNYETGAEQTQTSKTLEAG